MSPTLNEKLTLKVILMLAREAQKDGEINVLSLRNHMTSNDPQ